MLFSLSKMECLKNTSLMELGGNKKNNLEHAWQLQIIQINIESGFSLITDCQNSRFLHAVSSLAQ